MSTATHARHAAPAPKSRKARTFAVIALLMAAWMGIAGVAYAAFLREAAGTVNISTGSPNALSLTAFGTAPTFTQVGQTKPISFRVNNAATDAGVGETYSKYTLKSATVGTGPCASFFSISAPLTALVGGNGVLFRNVDTGAVASLTVGSGTDRRTEIPTDMSGDGPFQLTLAANAPAECANQASIPLDVVLTLKP